MKKKISIFIFSIFLLILPLFLAKAYASESYLSDKSAQYYTINNGLPSNQINDITTTDNGLIWLAGYSGLTKYDGKSFTTYSSYNDISIKNIMTLEADGNDLYLGTQSGLIKYNSKSFEAISLGSKYKISAINITDKIVYLGTNSGLLAVDKETKKVNIISTDSIVSITSYENDKIYYINESKELYIYYNGGSQRIVTNGFSPKTAVTIEDYIYLGGYDGTFYVRNLKNELQQKYTLHSKDEINAFYKVGNVVYIGTKTGLYTLSSEQVEYISDVKLSAISNIISDYQGNLWLASTSKGLAKIYKTIFKNLFETYDLINNKEISSTNTNAFTIYNNNYYIGTDTQLIKLNPYTSEVEILIEARIRGLKVLNNKLYIATYNSSEYDLAVYDGSSLSNITGFSLPGDEEEKNSKMVRCLEVSNDYLIVGTNYGISLVKDDKVITTTKLTNEPLSIYCKDDKIYVCIDVTSINVYDYSLKLLNSFPIVDSSPLKCVVVKDNLIYSENSTLYSINLKTMETTPLKLASNINGSITDIFEINNMIYLSTNSCELYIVENTKILDDNPKTTSLGLSNGFTSGSTANGCGYYDTQSRTYYFVTSAGVLYLNLQSINVKRTPLKMVINNIVVDDKSYAIDDTIAIDKNTSRITIDYSIVSFLEGDKITIHYKLDGVDQEYIEVSGDITEVSYTNLSGGTYNFHVYVTDETGNTSSETINFKIVKAYHIYEKAWFWILTILSTFIALGLLVFVYIRTKISKANEIVKLQRGITRESIIAIATSIDAKDKYTNGHSIRVGEYSRIIAEAMGYEGIDLENIYYTALLHDVGKIGVPDNVLNKPSRLNDDEFEIIKTHTVIGAEILKNITTIPNIIAGAKYHHEKYNGQGYPEGLKGEEIPLISRIICAADCYDAMATKRVYKPAFDKEKIISEFQRCSGTQFDPNIAELMIKLIEEGKIYPMDHEEITK